MSSLAITALTAAACSFAPLAHAANYFWDDNGVTAGFGIAGGTWAAPTVANWSTDGAGVADPATTPGNVTTTTTDTLNFGNAATGLAAGSIAISGNVSAGNITFASGSEAVAISGGTLTLANAETITVNNTTPNTISSTLAGMSDIGITAGTAGLTKAGSGTLVLANTNKSSMLGRTFISAGTLDFGTMSGTFGPAVTVTGGTATNSIVVTGGFLQANGTLTTGMTGNGAAFSAKGGDLIVNVGGAGASISLNSGGTGGLGGVTFGSAASTGKVIVQNTISLNNTNGSRTVTVNNATTAELAGPITNASSGLVKAGTGTLILSGANTYGSTTTLSNSTQVNAGTLQIGNGTDVGVIPTVKNINLNGVAATLAYNVGSGTRNQPNAIVGTGALTQNSSGGTLNLTGANTYSGLTTVTAGTLNTTTAQTGGGDVTVGDSGNFGVSQLANGDTLGVSTLTLGATGGSTLTVTPAAAPAAALINATTAFAVNGPTTLRVLGTPVSGTTLVSYAGGSVGGTSGFAGLALAMPFRVSGTLTNTGSAIELNSVVADTPKWRVGDGVWDIDTTVGAGGGGTANWKTVSVPVTTYVEAGSSIDKVTFDDTATGTSPITVTLNTTVTPAGITVNGTKNYTITGTGAIGGTGQIVKNGSSVFTLATANTFTSAVEVNGGTLKAGIAGAFGSPSSVTLADVAGVTLDLNGFNSTIGNLGGGGSTGGDVLLGGGTLTTGDSNADSTLRSLSGAGGLVKNGTGVLTFVGTTSGYTGATALNGGQLQVGTLSGPFGTGNITGAGNVFLEANGSTTTGITGGGSGFSALGGNLTVNVGGASALINMTSSGGNGAGGFIFGAPTSDSKVILQNDVGVNNFNGSRNITVNTGTGTASAEISGAIIPGGAGGISNIVKLGDGDLILSSANTYNGETAINAGRIILGNNLAFQNSPINTDNVGKIDATGFTTPSFGGLKGSADLSSLFDAGYSAFTSITLNAVNTDAALLATTPPKTLTTFGGVIADGAAGMSLIKTGVGTQTLDGANTYTGNTTISAGTLKLGVLGFLAAATNISIAAGGTFDLTDLTLSSGTYTWNTTSLSASGTATPATIAGTAGGTVDLGIKPITLTHDGTNAPLTVTGSGLSLSGNTFTVVVPGPALTAGVYTLVSGAAITGTVNPTPSYTGGSGLDSGLTGVVSISGGNTVILTVASGSGFATWITGTFTNGTVPGGQQDPSADPDKDGVSNLVEYAIAGMDPTVPNGSLGNLSGKTITFTKRLPLATDLTYAIEESTDLGVGDAWADVVPTVNDGTTISYTLPGPASKDFMRLKVTKIP